MFINHLEEKFQDLGLPTERPRLLLSIPLIAVTSADGPLREFEIRAIEEFAHDALRYDPRQMLFLSQWLLSPPPEPVVHDALAMLEELLRTPEMATVETDMLRRVLLHAERLLMLREIDKKADTRKGRQLLLTITKRFQIDPRGPSRSLPTAVEDTNVPDSGLRRRQPFFMGVPGPAWLDESDRDSNGF